jgi:hypothetical protein
MPAPFINSVAAHVCPHEPNYVSPEQVKAIGWGQQDEVIYLGAGYWRLQVVFVETPHFGVVQGVRLINPDRTGAEIQTVEQAVAILVHARRSCPLL